LEGSKVIKETKTGSVLQYYYDSSDEIVGFTYNGVTYVYLKNLQNDIIAIADVNGNIVVKYYYDAFGNILLVNDTSGISLGTKNPFRFKSYYYDEETQFYYLNSRYYDPFTGRFISADDASLLLGGETNIFKYCANNAIMNADPSGYRYVEEFILGKKEPEKEGVYIPDFSPTLYSKFYAEKEEIEEFANGAGFVGSVITVSSFWISIPIVKEVVACIGLTLATLDLSRQFVMIIHQQKNQTTFFGVAFRFITYLPL